MIEHSSSEDSWRHDNHCGDDDVESSLLSWRLDPTPLDNIDEPVEDNGQGDHPVGGVDQEGDEEPHMANGNIKISQRCIH